MTSCTLSRRDRTNDFAATHLSILCHRLFQALAASACISSGWSRTFAKASSETNWTVSADHLPPTSVASTTSLARPPSPASSGHVLSLCFRAISSASAGLRDAPRRAVPSLRRGVTIVVSLPTALRRKVADRRSPLPGVWHRGCCASPHPCIEQRRLSSRVPLPPSKPLLRPTPVPNLFVPTPLPTRTLPGGGQRRRVDGHTGSGRRTRKREAKAAEEQESEWLRTKPRGSISREADQWCTCHGPRPGQCHHLLVVSHAGPYVRVEIANF